MNAAGLFGYGNTKQSYASSLLLEAKKGALRTPIVFIKFFQLTSGISRLIIFVRLRWKPQNVKGAILMKKMLALVLALAMCLGCVALAEETAMV